jgi:hypothetical protein
MRQLRSILRIFRQGQKSRLSGTRPRDPGMRDKNASMANGADALPPDPASGVSKLVFGFHPWVHLLMAKRSRTRTTTKDENDWGSGGGGTKTHDCGYRLSQSDRSSGGSIATTRARFPYPVPSLLASFPNRPRPSSSFSSSGFG